jgi:hypothetical protein
LEFVQQFWSHERLKRAFSRSAKEPRRRYFLTGHCCSGYTSPAFEPCRVVSCGFGAVLCALSWLSLSLLLLTFFVHDLMGRGHLSINLFHLHTKSSL